MSSLPPPIPFNNLKCNTVLRGSSTKKIQENVLVVADFSVAAIISGFPQIVAVFKEIKISKVKVWLVTTLSTSSSGVISFAITPKDMVNAKDTYAGFSCTPGVMTRKSFQTLHGQYHPTEPDERNWFPINSTRQLFTAQIFAKDLPTSNSTNDTAVEVQLIWDAHVMFRGRTSPSTTDRSDRDEGFVAVDMPRVEAMTL